MEGTQNAAPVANAPEPTPHPPPPPEAPKRGRGRPRKDGSVPPPETPLTGDTPKRGRPPKRQAPEVDAPALAKQLMGLHMMGAVITGAPELQLTEAEAIGLAEAVAAIAREYNLSIDGKTGAAIQFIGACAVIYIPRLLKIKQRKLAHTAHDADEPPIASEANGAAAVN